MFGRVEGVANEVAALVADFDADAIPAESVIPVYETLDRMQRQIGAAKTMVARRVDEVQQWKRCGYPSAAEYLAAKSGSSVGAAKDELATSNKLTELPVIEDAMRAGKLSGPQAVAVANAASAAPAEQARLVNDAQRCSLNELKQECLRTKAAADPDREATHERIRRERYARTFTDAEGAWNMHVRGPVDAGARVEARLGAHIDEEFAQARAEDRREQRDAYAFDAFVAAMDHQYSDDEAGTNKPRIRHLGLLRVDLEALKRGIAGDDELCEITGLGPIPVSTARDLLGESILDLVITKGVDVLHVTHLGRGPTAAQKIALLFQQPLCTVEGCYRTRCEIDHRQDWTRTRHTRLDELDPLCKHHHNHKTYDRWALIDGTGKRPMVPPDDPRHPRHKPPP